ncbi:acyl-CoA dehydrogenase family protein [Micromonospora sp. LOL_024]|uniref:acyl-CoA dehydrogenase family protein n=1 Tax=Micromonospora sp. LOL_024 TaxID=3345412 RepID=UPI003A8C488B
MEQHLYDRDHDEFRELCRTFLARETVPHHERWEADGIVDREVWRSAGAAVAAAERLLALTLDARTREAFDRPIGRFQPNRFLLAELDTEVTIARTFLNHCVAEFNAGGLGL